MIRKLGLLMGGLFLFGGTLGFVPGVIKEGRYFGIFMVNPPHNLLHLASGAIFIIASLVGPRATRLWFQVFGMIYAAMALMGLKIGDGMICGVISNNRYDAWGHAGLALAMLVIGFASGKPNAAPTRTARKTDAA